MHEKSGFDFGGKLYELFTRQQGFSANFFRGCRPGSLPAAATPTIIVVNYYCELEDYCYFYFISMLIVIVKWWFV